MENHRLAGGSSVKEERRATSRWITWAGVGGAAVAFGVLVAFAILQAGGKPASAASGMARVGSPAPDFTLKLFKEQTVTLSSLKGKPVLVSFWHSA